MSYENVVRFMERLHIDDELGDKVDRLQGDGGPESVRILLRVAEEAGYPFEEAEMDALIMAMAAGEQGELSEDELDRAAGGLGDSTLMDATKEMQEMNQSFSLQYQGLQTDMQQSNRQFAMMSNIMQTKHDTAQNSINNTR